VTSSSTWPHLDDRFTFWSRVSDNDGHEDDECAHCQRDIRREQAHVIAERQPGRHPGERPQMQVLRLEAFDRQVPDDPNGQSTGHLFAAGILEEAHRLPGPRGATYFRTADKTGWTELKALCRAVLKDSIR
jgi:hypothetical protein